MNVNTDTVEKTDNQVLGLDDMKQFCIRNVNSLGKVEREEVLEFLIVNTKDDEIDESPSGCRIHLDTLSESTIKSLFGLIKYKLEN